MRSTPPTAPRCPECGRGAPPTTPAYTRCPCGAGVFGPPIGADPLAGRIIARYAVGPPLGGGASARVYAAHDGRRPVALKVLRADADPRIRQRFAREARALMTLRGPHTVRLLDIGEAHDRAGRPRPWIAQPRIPGRSLLETLADGPPPPALLEILAEGMLRALEEAHGAGITHRDLKPCHIMLTPGGGLVVLDFGLARLGDDRAALDALTTTGALLGTPPYMAPEQIDHRAPIGPPADLYAAGVILYEALVGRRPFEGLDPLAVLRAHLDDRPPPVPRRSALARRWAPVIERALAKHPADRPPSAAAMRRALSAPAPRIRWRWPFARR